jgi:hypothetical protein
MEASRLKEMFDAMIAVSKDDLTQVELLIKNEHGQLVPANFIVRTHIPPNGAEGWTDVVFEVESKESIDARGGELHAVQIEATGEGYVRRGDSGPDQGRRASMGARDEEHQEAAGPRTSGEG